MTTIASLKLPALTRLEAEAARRDHVNRDLLSLGSGLQLRLCEAGAHHRYGPKPVRIVLSWGEAVLALHCPMELAHDLVQGLDPGLEALETLPPDLAGLLLEAASANLIEVWEHCCGRDIAVAEAACTLDPPTPGGLAFELSDAKGRHRLHLDCTPAQAAAILSSWPVAARDMDWFTLPAVLRLGVTRLSHAMLASLRPGDAVLLQHHLPHGAMLVVNESWVAGAQCAAECWTITEPPVAALVHGRGDWTMTDEPVDLNPAADPDDIPVMLTFEVGRLTLALGRLRRLAPGSVLELGRRPGELVEIAVQGRSVGRGELVDIEGIVGVRIVWLFDND